MKFTQMVIHIEVMSIGRPASVKVEAQWFSRTRAVLMVFGLMIKLMVKVE